MPVLLRCPNPACGRTAPAADPADPFRCPACGRVAAPGAAAVVAPADVTNTWDVFAAPPTVTIGRFVIKARVGEGAAGTVYRAFDPHLDRDVALKVPTLAALVRPDWIERFFREARAAARLRHPNIVPVFDAGKDGDWYYIATAFIDGPPLAATIAERGGEFRRAARVVRELADALAYAHAEGVVHRDVKPANIMVDATDRVHLMDFGLAARRDAGIRLTADGALLGTPRYMAPEQATGKTTEVGPAADQYAAGVVLYELLTGSVPFNGTMAEILHKIAEADPEPLRQLRPDVPKDLEAVCLKAMAKRPVDRYPDCRALADDLRRWLDGEPVTARRPGARERLGRWVRTHPAVAGFVAALAVAAAAAGVLAATALGREGRAGEETVLAREEAAQARDEAKRADEQAQRAAAALGTAGAERDRANRDAEAARTEVRAAADRERAAGADLYAARMTAAQAAWDDGDTGRLLALLDAARPGPGRPDLRGPEWYHWDRLARSASRVLAEVGSPAEAMTYSPDGRQLAVALRRDAARVIDADTGRTVRELKHPGSERVADVAYSGDGRWVATAARSADEVVVWDAQTGERSRGWRVQADAVALTPKGDVLVAGGPDDRVQVLDVKTGDEIAAIKLPKGTGPVRLALSPDGARVAVRSRAVRATVYEVRTGKPVFTYGPAAATDWQPHAVAFFPESDRFLVPLDDGSIALADVGRQVIFGRLDGSTRGTPRAVAMTRDGSRIVAGYWDGLVKVWDARTGRVAFAVPGPPGWDGGMAVSPDGTRVAAGCGTTVRIMDIRGRPDRVAIPEGNHGVGFTADGARVVAGGAEVAVWDAATGAKVHALGPGAGCLDLRVSPDGQRAVSVHTDNHLRAWNPAKPGAVWDVEVPATARIGFSPDGRYLAGGGGGRVWVRDAATGRVVKEFPPLPAAAYEAIGFSPDGRHLAATRKDGVTVWRADDWGEHRSLAEPGASALAWRPGGELAVGTESAAVRLWDADLRAARVEWKGAGVGPVVGLAFSPDGERLAVGAAGEDAVRVWDMRARSPVWRLDGRSPGIAWSPDGRRVALAPPTGKLTVWGARPTAK